jgi:uncharacterized protein
MGDDSWRMRPRVMSQTIIDALAFRISEHAATHRILDVDVVLHGGEPLLAGPKTIAYAVDTIRAALGPDTRASFNIQTNGVLLDENFMRLFEELDVRVGLSMDGAPGTHDRHRRLPEGGGSYSRVAAAANLLSKFPRLFSGILSVIDLNSDPVEAYDSLTRFSPPVMDFLLPHGNWSSPPPGRTARDATTPYADWLIAVFDRWYAAPETETTVRLFSEIMNLLLGGSSRIEEIGPSPAPIAVVQPDGDIALSDVIATADQMTDITPNNVARDPFDSVFPTVPPGVPIPCRGCSVVSVCGGGLYAHRYQTGGGFDNPSVYCADLYHLITHIRGRLHADLAPRIMAGEG